MLSNNHLPPPWLEQFLWRLRGLCDDSLRPGEAAPQHGDPGVPPAVARYLGRMTVSSPDPGARDGRPRPSVTVNRVRVEQVGHLTHTAIRHPPGRGPSISTGRPWAEVASTHPAPIASRSRQRQVHPLPAGDRRLHTTFFITRSYSATASPYPSLLQSRQPFPLLVHAGRPTKSTTLRLKPSTILMSCRLDPEPPEQRKKTSKT